MLAFFFVFCFVIPLNYYNAESVSFITRRNKDDVGWFLVHKSASSEAQNMTTETYDNDKESTSILAAILIIKCLTREMGFLFNQKKTIQ